MAYGTVNTDIVADSSGGKLAPISSVFRNRIINGAMVIDQRNAGASTTPSATATNIYTLDRWAYFQSVASKFAVQQNAGSVTPPVGFSNYLGLTSQSAYSVGSSDYFGVMQIIEGFNTSDLGWGTANAKTVTLSFQVYSSLTGTFGGAIQNAAQNRSYPFAYTISSANTWTPISITIAGDTGGTWVGASNSGSVRINFGLGMGSSFSGTAGAWASANTMNVTGATSVVGTSGATFYITGVQLEVGSSATGFEYVNYQTSLANCQRYYFDIRPIATGYTQYPATMESSAGGTGFMAMVTFPVKMRAIPTLIVGASMTNYNLNWVFAGSSQVTSISGSSYTSELTGSITGVKTSSFLSTGAVAGFQVYTQTQPTGYSAEL